MKFYAFSAGSGFFFLKSVMAFGAKYKFNNAAVEESKKVLEFMKAQNNFLCWKFLQRKCLWVLPNHFFNLFNTLSAATSEISALHSSWRPDQCVFNLRNNFVHEEQEFQHFNYLQIFFWEIK